MRREFSYEVNGPWSLATSRSFWEGFTPAALTAQQGDALTTVFLGETDWLPVEVSVTQEDTSARMRLEGDGDLEAAARQVRRFLSLDVDARAWPAVGQRDHVIADAQLRLAGLRPCGFHSPYEAAAWAVLSQRIRIRQAAVLRRELTDRFGVRGAFPAPAVLLEAGLDLPGRKAEYLHAVAEAALDATLDATRLRSLDPDEAVRQVQEIKGLGPFSAELVVIRGANAPDALPAHETRLDAEIIERYGPGADLAVISQTWRPYRSWAVVHLRTLRELRTHEIGG